MSETAQAEPAALADDAPEVVTAPAGAETPIEADLGPTASAGTPANVSPATSIPAKVSPEAGTPANVADVEEALRDVVDPELGINIVDLGLVYGVAVEPDNSATVDMTLTSAACPLTDDIEAQAHRALVEEGVVDDFRINWVWMPPWGPDKITEDGREQLRALGFNV
jgi:metal-sulfur cluster biosynthetic enzyme